VFFYGTLRDAALLDAVIGRGSDIDRRPARLRGFEVRAGQEQPYPWLLSSADPEALAQGCLVNGLSAVDLDRLGFYEGAFDYDTRQMTVDTDDGPMTARVYVPLEPPADPGPTWDFAAWQARWGSLSRAAAAEFMLQYGRKPAGEVAYLLPFFRARAWSQELASVPAPQTLRSDKTIADVEITPHEDGYDGFFRLQSFSVRHRQFDGTWSEPFDRAAFVSYDAALVLPYDPVADKVLLVEQLRFGPMLRKDPTPWILEPVAGLVDPGETPQEAARREAREEADLELTDLIPVSRGYAAPGYCSEYYHSYVALCDLSQTEKSSVGGLDEEHEDIRRHVISFDHAMALIASGEINAVPLQALLFWLAANRARLRAGGPDA
jgi:nudix-type nucleoside diphosphatase (YffH/AdpP family)